MHDGCAITQVCTQANTAGIANSDACGHGVVSHAGEFVDTLNVQAAAFCTGFNLALGQLVQRDRTLIGPSHVWKLREQTGQIEFMGFSLTCADEGQFQVHLGSRAGFAVFG